jgi:proton-dependent oligopeptide transporter, POT family
METSNNSNNSLGIIPVSFSKILERFAFYGMRSIFIIYMSRQLAYTPEHANYIYSIFIGVVGFLPILGGLLGDLLFGKKLAFITGGFIQGAGYFLMAVPNQIAFYSGLFLIAFGCGLYTPNSASMLSSIYQGKPAKMDSAFTIIYVCLNFGALISQVFIPFFTDNTNFQFGFILCGIIITISQLILIFLRSLFAEVPNTPGIYLQETPKETKTELRIIIIAIIILVIPLYWMIYDVAGFHIYALKERIGESSGSLYRISLQAGSIVTLFMGIILAILWYFVKMSSFLKMTIGLLIYAFAFIFISTIHDNSASTGLMILIFVFIFLESVAELFIAPIALSIIARYASTKFNATIIGTYLCSSSILNYFASSYLTGVSSIGATFTFLICAAVSVICAVPLFIFYFLTRKNTAQK